MFYYATTTIFKERIVLEKQSSNIKQIKIMFMRIIRDFNEFITFWLRFLKERKRESGRKKKGRGKGEEFNTCKTLVVAQVVGYNRER